VSSNRVSHGFLVGDEIRVEGLGIWMYVCTRGREKEITKKFNNPSHDDGLSAVT
jgi:hypothetical protein